MSSVDQQCFRDHGVNPEFAKHVLAADNIRTSGRWGAMNAKIKHLASNTAPQDEWYLELFAGLCYQSYSGYDLMRRAYDAEQRGDVPLIAWRARNLLEISIWATYFASGREPARRIYEDAGRDALEIMTVFQRWGEATSQSTEWLTPLKTGKEDLLRRAEREGIETLDGQYKGVAAAARECGIYEQYSLGNKLLSKFAHPTAMQILGVSDEPKVKLQRDTFFGQGCLFFTGAFNALERAPF
jgi:hypothetical protein